jgi:hypothetical protein
MATQHSDLFGVAALRNACDHLDDATYKLTEKVRVMSIILRALKTVSGGASAAPAAGASAAPAAGASAAPAAGASARTAESVPDHHIDDILASVLGQTAAPDHPAPAPAQATPRIGVEAALRLLRDSVSLDKGAKAQIIANLMSTILDMPPDFLDKIINKSS